MNDQITTLKQHVTQLASKENFRHHQWFIKYHLEIVEKIALELLEKYPEADRDTVLVMCWIHDYGKILDFDNQYSRQYVDQGIQKLIELGFDKDFAKKVGDYVELFDKHGQVDLHTAPIEVRIASTADACSHFASPFHYTYWHENPTKSTQEIIDGKPERINIDWNDKIVLPEAKAVFEKYYKITLIQNGQLPERYL